MPFGTENGAQVKLLGVTCEGILTVTDADGFRAALVSGMGRDKAYGMGLLTVMRAHFPAHAGGGGVPLRHNADFSEACLSRGVVIPQRCGSMSKRPPLWHTASAAEGVLLACCRARGCLPRCWGPGAQQTVWA